MPKNNLEGIIRKTALVAGLALKGGAIYIAYYKGGGHFLNKNYSEAAKYFFLFSAPLGIAGNILLGTSCLLYAKGFYKKISNRFNRIRSVYDAGYEKQMHKQNKINLIREFCIPEEKANEIYSKAMDEVKKDSKEFYPFAVYRRARDELKK
jgi:hypothetical protein